ncbi:unnamed protein product, partial [marine sediment metagenome]
MLKTMVFMYIETLGNRDLFVGSREATEEEYRDLRKTYDLFDKKLEASAKKATGDDDNARTALGEDFFKRPWGYTVASNWGVWGMAQNSKDYSPVDWWNSVGGGQHYCREGYGTLVAHYDQSVPVSLGTWVKEIDWQGDGVKVITLSGTIKARAAILTVSVGVLAFMDKSSGQLHIIPMRSSNLLLA